VPSRVWDGEASSLGRGKSKRRITW
jgi:hypothetical protein